MTRRGLTSRPTSPTAKAIKVSAGRIRSFDEAEVNYRTGYEAGRNPAYADREFEEVEPDLRARHGAATTNEDEWVRLREEIRYGWSKARGR